ncbi:sigma 54-interacting transcriptional regulator [Sorangium sp. So ce131]|uniref:sigma 54-interacting transcriptional regulator n=1 Tax=Sorangium sp. So ce131 TaxID=3133282 RepID=UPI003F61DFC1
MSNHLDLTGATSVRGLVADMPDGTFVITIADGPAAGQRLELDGSSPSRVLVGKSSACDVKLDDPEVSRRHCALEIAGARLRVTDLGSTNGTFVDHVAIRDAWLAGGETLRVGATRLRVERHAGGRNPPVPPGSSFGRMLGASRAMRRLYPLCQKLAAARVPVLIEGETGTGKEVLAEALHEQGPLAARPFVVFDCTAVPPSLVESELFGHERGAFTGATAARRGVFEQADGGTLFIDEIGDLDLALQPKLLRAIERGEIRRVGGDRWIRVDARILSATRRDLDHEVQAGRFRDDLFHRLAVARIELPPLRARAGDVALLAQHFWTLAGAEGAPPPALVARWSDDAWPGNLRELRNAVLRAVALGDAALPPEEAHEEAAPASAAGGGAGADARREGGGSAGGDFMAETLRARLPLAAARSRVVEEFERRYVEQVLAAHDGVVSRAAAASGIARRHFQRIKARSR